MVLYKTRITKALIRLCGCAGWSAPVLFANPRRQVFSRRAKSIPALPLFTKTLVNFHWTRIRLGPVPLASCGNGSGVKVSKVAKIRNRYNQVPHLTQDTNGKVTNSQKTPQTRAKRSALSQQVTTKHI